jgi:ATP-dependent Clp protease ATP-binding subunit ClpC
MRSFLQTLGNWLWRPAVTPKLPPYPFTDRALKVLSLSNLEACTFNHEYIGPEHLLLALLNEGSGLAAHVLRGLFGDLAKLRTEMESQIVRGPAQNENLRIAMRPLTPRASRALDHASAEANGLNHEYVGTEHLLLGVLREENSLPCQMLRSIGIDAKTVRNELLKTLGGT